MKETVLITGASSGIGYEFAKIFADRKCDLVLVARNESKLKEIKAELEENDNVKILVIVQDLSTPEAAKKIFEELTEKQIQIDVLINNAGFGEYGFFSQTNWEKEEQMIQVNIVSLSHLTKLLLPSMIERKKGKIFNVASTAAFQPGPLMAVYYASKAYVLSFTEAIANELKGSGVTVTVLCPGATASGFQAAAAMEDSKLVKGKNLPTAAEVAQFGYDTLQKGKTVAVHGFANKFLALLVRFLPRATVTNIVRATQERA